MAKRLSIISGAAAALIVMSPLTFAQSKKAEAKEAAVAADVPKTISRGPGLRRKRAPALQVPARTVRRRMESMSLPTRRRLAKK